MTKNIDKAVCAIAKGKTVNAKFAHAYYTQAIAYLLLEIVQNGVSVRIDEMPEQQVKITDVVGIEKV